MEFFKNALLQAIREGENGNTDFFITLEAKDDQSKWIQFTWDSINLAYPFNSEPAQNLSKLKILLPNEFELIAWEKNLYVTFSHNAEKINEITGFAEEYARRIFEIEPISEAINIVD